MMSKLISCHSDASTSSSSTSSDGPQSQMLKVTPYLTEHLVSEILCRLPVKTLLQYRCVSKPWCSLIDSPRFVKTHLKRSIECNTNTGLVIRGDNFHLVDFDSLEHTTPVEIDEPLKTHLYGCSIVSSINGLHCLFNPKPDIFLWNPATRKYRHLPTLPADFNGPFGFGGSSLCGFGYDAANDDYKVMRIQTDDSGSAGSKVIVYGLKTHSWKRHKNIPYKFQYFGVWGMFMGGSLHWITIKGQGCPSILAVDLGVENHRELPLPKLRTKNANQLSIITFEKSLCILEYLLSVRMNVWVMKDYGVGKSWCKLFSVEQRKVIGSFVTITPLAYSKSRKDVLFEVDNEKVMWYNPETKKARTAKIANLPGIFDLEVYTESLVPLEYNMSSVGKQLPKQPLEKEVQQQKKNKDESDGSRLPKLNVSTTEHLITEILCRLPVKILLRFRCVSKPWCSLIDSPRFIKAHLKRSTECKNNKPGIIIKSFISYSVDFDSLHNNATTAIEIDEPLLNATGDVGSCNGLHCLYNLETDMFLWNPAMRKCRKLPTAPAEFLRPFEFDQSSLCGFGYDAGNDDYKVLRIVQPDGHDLCGSKVTIYSLKTNSWRRLQNISGHFQFWGAWGIFMGGALHWITVTPLGSPSILAFDLGVENYREVAMPRLQNKNVEHMNMVIFAESLCMLEYFPLIRIDVWVMKDYGVGNSWCKLFSVEQPKVTRCGMSIRPIFYSKSHKDVLLEVDSKEVMWYNLKRKKAKTVKIANLPEIFDLEVYTESLVSPDYNFSCGGSQLPSQPQEKKEHKQQQQRNKSNGPQSQLLKVTPYLTEHLVSEILSCLPVKTLLQYRCVSKPWCSLIDSPRFVKTHLKRSIEGNTNTGLIIRGDNFHLVDFDSLEHTTPVEIDEPLKTRLYGCSIVSSVDGLHCLYNPKPDIFIWNPATRKYRHLPTLPADFNSPFGFGGSSLCGFGYDAANDDYKVMRIQADDSGLEGSKVIVYGLKTHSWKRHKNIPYQFQYFGVWGMFMGGSLHWITIKGQGCPSILAVDLGVENHRELPLPKLRTKNVNQLSIITFEKSLCILEYLHSVCMNVWVMKDYGVGKSWCKLFSVEQRKVIGSFVTITPLAYSKSRKDVLLEVDNKKVMWYNPIRKKARTAKIVNLPSIFDLEVYTQSLVPLDYNMSSDGKQLQKQPQEKKVQQQKKKKDERDKFLATGFKLVL